MDVFEAIYKGDFNSVKIFLEKGGDVNTIDDSDYTALSMAALMGQSNIVKLLKKYGAKTDFFTEVAIGDINTVKKNI